jgi:hypothetical protein
VKSGRKNFDKKVIKEKEPKIKVLAHDFFLEHIEELHIFILRKRGKTPVQLTPQYNLQTRMLKKKDDL